MMEMSTPIEVQVAQDVGVADKDVDSCTIHDGMHFVDSCSLYNYFETIISDYINYWLIIYINWHCENCDTMWMGFLYH